MVKRRQQATRRCDPLAVKLNFLTRQAGRKAEDAPRNKLLLPDCFWANNIRQEMFGIQFHTIWCSQNSKFFTVQS